MAAMEFEWDDAKDAANRTKHGVSLADAVGLDWEVGVDLIDSRGTYGEVRIIRYARIESRLWVCVYVYRNEKRRIISLRKANKREIIYYGISR